MKTRKANPAELNRIKAYYWDLIDGMQDVEYPTKWQKGIYPSDEDLQGFLSRGELYLLEDKDEIIGSMAINHTSSEGYDQITWQIEAAPDEISVIHILGVSPGYQKRGIAKHLVEEAIRIAKEEQQRSIRLDALSENIPAQHVYTQKGFQYRGSVELYYENTGKAEFYLYEYIL